MLSLFRRKRDPESEFLDTVFVHADGLYRYALRLCGDDTVAEELVQDTMTKAFRAFGNLRAETNHRAWVYTILRNTFISRCRKAGREEELTEPERVVDHRMASAEQRMVTPEDGYRHAFEDEVLMALRSLPEHQRTAIVLCDIEGMRYEEIADIMGCPVGTVRSRIHHGRRRLRKTLAEYAHHKGYGKVDEAV